MRALLCRERFVPWRLEPLVWLATTDDDLFAAGAAAARRD
jgi:hypothetical protein